MSPSREFNAGSVESAVTRAAADIGVAESDIEYEVLDAGSEGFLGIGARDARILVNLPDEQVGIERDPDPEPDQAADTSNLDSDDAEADDAPHSPTTSEEDPSNLDVDDDPDSSSALSLDVTEDDDSEEHEAVSEEALADIEAYVQRVVDAMDIRSRIDVYDVGENIAVDISSDHTALLIGQKGETIDALQHLINSATFRKGLTTKRVVLDSEGYRQRRIEALQGMAHRSARKAAREGREIKMPPMNSSERRVIHLFLEDNESVTTYSEGKASGRRVIISPE